MTCKIGGIDIGTVQRVEPAFRRPQSLVRPGGSLAFWQNIYADAGEWRVTGYLKAPTVAQKMSLLGLKHGLPVLVDLNDKEAGFICWGRVAEVHPRPSRIAGAPFYYDLFIRQIPGIGTTYLQTTEAWLHDLDYQSNLRMFDPAIGRFAKSLTSDRLDWTWEMYVDNDKVSTQTVIGETQTGVDIEKAKIWGWKDLSPHAWSLIGDWGGADAWDAQKTFVDDNAISHVLRLNKGVKGQVLAGIGTVSNMLGLDNRILYSITLMQAEGSADTSLDHSLDQLLLKITVEHTLREALRPYPIVRYVDGSLDWGTA